MAKKDSSHSSKLCASKAKESHTDLKHEGELISDFSFCVNFSFKRIPATRSNGLEDEARRRAAADS